ncbi:MAG: glycosyltransferase family 39 protein [Anaerolineae bacterium]
MIGVQRWRLLTGDERRKTTWLWALILFAIALVPRAFALNHTVTPDEPNWVYRTLNFSQALARGDWAATAQAGHPGVTTMWLGSLGIALERSVDPARTSEALDWLSKIDRLSSENIEALRRIGVFLDWARLLIIAVNALGVVGVFLFVRHLFNQPIALLAAFLLALDPFVAGLGGLLHVDGLLATFSTLSVLALLNGVSPSAYHESQEAPPHSASRTHPSSSLWFALSGACAGLALLSKSPALVLIPFTILIIAIAVLTKRLSIRHALLGLLIFLILHSVCFIALYPALWSDPSSALDLMFERATYHATTATRQTFFDGQAELNHGLGFYPLALGYRLSPVVILGLILAVLFLMARTRPSGSHTPNLTFLLFTVTFIIFLSLAAKKFDRYLLPAIPPLIIITAWAIHQLSHRLTSRLANTLPPAAIMLQSLLTVSIAPYPLMAYNPILGGASGARDRIAVGWGEGFGAAAQWIAANDPSATIASGGLSNVAPLYAGRTVTIDEAGLAAADYIVFTVSEVQLAPEFFNSLAQRGTLTHTIRIGGVDAAWVYANARPAAQADWLRRETQPGDAIVLDAPTPLARRRDGITVLPRDATPERISSTLNAIGDSSRILYISTAAASPIVRRDVRAWLGANGRQDNETSVAGSTIRIYTPHRRATQPLDPFGVQFDGALELIGLEPLAHSVAYPNRIDIAARWRVIAQPTTHYSATLELTDADGNGWIQFGGPLRNAGDFAPIDWQPGEVTEQVFSIQTPPAIAPGAYRVRFSVDRADGSRAALVSASGAFSGTAPMLASVQIDPARQPPDSGNLAVGRRIERDWPGQVELIGIDLLSRSAATGDPLLSTLHWRSLREGLDPATELSWILEPDSAVDAQPFEWRTLLAPNTHTPLRDGDLIAVRYADRLPLDLTDGRYRLRLAIGDDAIGVETIDVVHRERTFDLPAGASSLGSIGTFDIFLIEPLPAQVRAGDSMQVKLAIRARDEVLVNYTVFVHLRDPAGRVVAQMDTWPQGGAWPTANWVRGQVVEDRYPLTLPPDAALGDYRIAVGMYDSLDGSRLLSRDGDDRLILNTAIQVIEP